MPLSLMHRQYIPSARMVIFFLFLLLATGVAKAATFGVTTPGQQTLTNRFLPYAGSGTQLIGNSPAWRDSAGVLGINNYLEGLETLTPAAAVNLNFSTWRTKRITLNQNTVFTAINIPSASTNVQTMLLEVIGDGAFTVSFANVTWQTPEITTPEAGVVTLYALRGDSGAVKGYTQAIAATGIGPLTSGYIPLANSTNNVTDSILSQSNGYTILLSSTNTQDHAIIFSPVNTNSGTSFIRFDGTDTDGTASLAQVSGFKGTGWGIGAPAQRDGTYSVNVQHDNALNERFEISGDTGLVRFLDRDGMNSIFEVANGSGYTGGGTLFLSDDGTYKAAGGAALWASSSGNLTPSPAVDVVSIESQSADASTNVALVVKSTTTWTNNSALLARFANAGSDALTISRDGGMMLGKNSAATWGTPAVNGTTLIQYQNLALGDPNLFDLFMGVKTNSQLSSFEATGNLGAVSVIAYSGGNEAQWRVTDTLTQFKLDDKSGVEGAYMLPNGPNTFTPYFFGTANITHPSGNLVEIVNNTTNKVVIDYAGNVTANSYTAGATNLVGAMAGKQPLDSTLTTMSGKSTTGSGDIVLATSPTLVTPTLGVATATSLSTGYGTNTALAISMGTSDSGIYNSGATLRLQHGGTVGLFVGSGAVQIPSGSSYNINADTYLIRDSAARFQQGVDAAAVVTPQIFGTADGTGTDKAGATKILAAGRSTGTGRPGDLSLTTGSTTTTSGSGVNADSTRFYAVSKPVDLTGGAATAFQKFTMATNNYAGMEIVATVRASDAAFAMQSLTSVLKIDAVNVGGTNSVQITQVDNTLAQIPAGGTLTCAYDAIDEGSNVFSIRANAASSLTETILRVKWVITALNSSDAITVTPQ